MLTSLVATLSIFASATLAQSNKECYQKVNDKIWHQPWGWYACDKTAQQSGGALLCCIDGYECGSDSLCHKTTSGGADMWMVGGCTDKDFSDPVCRQECSEDKHTFISYNKGEKLWECCGDKGCQNDDFTGEKFDAVSPEDWKPIAGDSSPDPPSNSPSSDDSNDSLSSGAKIGIGIGVAIVVAALVAAAVFFFRRNNKRPRQPFMGIKGKYEELSRGRAPSPQPYAARAPSPQPYGRSTSPIPPVRSFEPQRARSRSPAVDERSPLPALNFSDHGDGA